MNLKTLLAFTLMITASTACVGRFNGGGYIPGVGDPDVKATFGFTGHASDSNNDGQADTFKGQFQFADRSAGIKVHVEAVTAIFVENDPFTHAPTARINGITDTGESVNTLIVDRGPAGPSSEDTFFISISRGSTGIYDNLGTIRGGNVTWLPE